MGDQRTKNTNPMVDLKMFSKIKIVVYQNHKVKLEQKIVIISGIPYILKHKSNEQLNFDMWNIFYKLKNLSKTNSHP